MTMPRYDWDLKDDLEDVSDDELKTIIVYLSDRIDVLEERISALELEQVMDVTEVDTSFDDMTFDDPELDEDEIIWESRPKEKHLHW